MICLVCGTVASHI
uniref:Uncharacterized protein n=1 Tax=Anguilla anguilla TaxID=7936 RepID=A0A0E9TLQ9_ANGAN